jgi:hypothetical protein
MSKKPRLPKIQVTKNYSMFVRDPANRDLEPDKHEALKRSMEESGFMVGWPAVCRRGEKGQLRTSDGQHRIHFAERLNLPVFYLVVDDDFDIARINSTPKSWSMHDFAAMHAGNGLNDYQEGMDFAKHHGLPIGKAFCLLAGTTSFANIHYSFKQGSYAIKDRAWADAVATIYAPLTKLSADVRNARFLEACMAVTRVAGFDSKRFLKNAQRCREKLVSYSTRDAYLEMIEEIYNFGRKSLVSLKIDAITALRDRNLFLKKKKAKSTQNHDHTQSNGKKKE